MADKQHKLLLVNADGQQEWVDVEPATTLSGTYKITTDPATWPSFWVPVLKRPDNG